MEPGEVAEQIAEATPNVSTGVIHPNTRQFARRVRQLGGQVGTSSQVFPPVDTQHEGSQIPSLEETNIQLEESGPSTSAGHPVIDLPTKENFQAMSDDDKYEIIQQWRSEMTSLLNKMRQLATTSHRQTMEPISLRHQQSQHPNEFVSPGTVRGA